LAASSSTTDCPPAVRSDHRRTRPPTTPGSGGATVPNRDPRTTPLAGSRCGYATATVSPTSGSATTPRPLPAPGQTTANQPRSTSPWAGSVTRTRPSPAGSSTSVTTASVVTVVAGTGAGRRGGSVVNRVR